MYHLLLDSSLANMQCNGANQKSLDFKIVFNLPIILDRRWSLYEACTKRRSTTSSP